MARPWTKNICRSDQKTTKHNGFKFSFHVSERGREISIYKMFHDIIYTKEKCHSSHHYQIRSLVHKSQTNSYPLQIKEYWTQWSTCCMHGLWSQVNALYSHPTQSLRIMPKISLIFYNFYCYLLISFPSILTRLLTRSICFFFFRLIWLS